MRFGYILGPWTMLSRCCHVYSLCACPIKGSTNRVYEQNTQLKQNGSNADQGYAMMALMDLKSEADLLEPRHPICVVSDVRTR